MSKFGHDEILRLLKDGRSVNYISRDTGIDKRAIRELAERSGL